MKRKEFISCIAAGISLSVLREELLFSGKPDLPLVLLIGDSISIGYTPVVQDILKGTAAVFRPLLGNGDPENCNGTTYGVRNIDRWIGEKKWDVIHFNFGLHDIKHVDPKTGEGTTGKDDPLQADIKQYSRNMKLIVGRLRSTGAKLIFAATTPVPDGPLSPLREPENVMAYNAAAERIMRKRNIPVNDLYSVALPRLKEIQRPDNVHFTEEGYGVLAQEVANSIRLFL